MQTIQNPPKHSPIQNLSSPKRFCIMNKKLTSKALSSQCLPFLPLVPFFLSKILSSLPLQTPKQSLKGLAMDVRKVSCFVLVVIAIWIWCEGLHHNIWCCAPCNNLYHSCIDHVTIKSEALL